MRAPDLSLREDATDARTIDGLLASGFISGWQRHLYQLISEVAVSIRGDARQPVRLGAMVPTMYSLSRHEFRYGQTECELRGTLLGLVTAGLTPISIVVGDSPDGLVTLVDGTTIGVEHAEVVDPVSARYSNMMTNLSRDARDDVEADADALERITGHHVEVRIGRCPEKAQIRAVRQELIEMFRTGSFLSVPERVLGKAPGTTLQSINTTVYRAPWKHGSSGGSRYIIGIKDAAHSFDPLSLAPIAMRRLSVKKKAGLNYNVEPLWLVLTVTDLRGVWDESMAYLGNGCPPIAPYDRVIVCDGGRAIIWANGIMAIRNVRS